MAWKQRPAESAFKPIKVASLELARLPEAVPELAGYDRVFVLFRYHGRPVGQALLPVVDGRLTGTAVRDAVNRPENWPLWEQKLYEFLAWEPPDYGKAPLPTATVAVCTRDRPEDLARCLEALLRLPDDGQELLVVDNCPATEATRILVERYGGQVRYIREARPGLNVARNRALREARGEIVAFNDDDAVPDSDWLRALRRNFAEPSVLCVTGLTMPLELETAAQLWFERYAPFGRGFQRHHFRGSTVGALRAGHAGAGANMALRRCVLEAVGPFDEALDSGTRTRSGGDTEMFARLLGAGYDIVYDPAALNWHRHRRSWPELRRAAYGYGAGTYASWARQLLVERRLTVLYAAGQHFLTAQLPQLLRSLLRRPGCLPLDLLLAEWAGCAAGLPAYLVSHRETQRNGGFS